MTMATGESALLICATPRTVTKVLRYVKLSSRPTLGTKLMKSSVVEMPASWIAWPENAATWMGTSCSDYSHRWAVTTTFSNRRPTRD